MLPSTRVSVLEVYSRDDKNLVLTNNERIEWLAGGLLENLFYRLFDEAGREVPLTAEIAPKIKVCLDYKMHSCSVFSYYADKGFVNVSAVSDSSGSGSSLLTVHCSLFKVNWTGDVDLTDLAQGRLPEIQVPTQVQEERFYQVSYQDQSLSVSFTIL